MSGYSDFEYARKAIRLGVTEYLLKPVNFNELYDALRKIKDKQQAAARLRHELKQLDNGEQKAVFSEFRKIHVQKMPKQSHHPVR